jgi:hypothetical protein
MEKQKSYNVNSHVSFYSSTYGRFVSHNYSKDICTLYKIIQYVQELRKIALKKQQH